MGRSPCCDKMGLKKGPWAQEEDQILVEYIQRNGHGNWRALPKQAGLLRCGKSCRLRWTNYLRPDIKRGSFSPEEEETIIKLHKILGNRWSAIAARLPGRTDNEIKNVWHTHLKKRLDMSDIAFAVSSQSSPSASSITDSSTSTAEISPAGMKAGDPFGEINQISRSDQVLSSEQEEKAVDQFRTNMVHAHHHDHYFIESPRPVELEQLGYPRGPYNDDDLDFWFHLYVNAGELSKLPAF